MFKLWILFYYLRLRLRRFTSRKEVVHFQNRQWAKHWRFLKQHSPFYKNIDANHPSPAELPLMNKAAMMQHFDALNTRNLNLSEVLEAAVSAEQSRNFSHNIAADLSVGLSSGTSGNRGVFVVSKRERALWVAAVLHRVIGWNWKLRQIAFFLRADNKLYQSVKSRLLQFSFFDLLRPFDELVGELKLLQPDIVVAQPSVLRMLAISQQAGTIHIQPKQIIAVAEVLSPEVKLLVESVFAIPVKQVYQCTEGFLASSCKLGMLHFHEDLLIINPQWIDAEKRRCMPVVTDFTRRVQPVVNYLLNDIVHLSHKPCSCGSPFLCIEKIEGRADDMLLFRRLSGSGVLVFPDLMRRLMLLHLPEVTHYQIEQVNEELLHCNLEAQLPQEAANRLKAAMANWCAEHGLKLPGLLFGNSPVFEPMQKFRTVKRRAGIQVDGLDYL